jgi:membrane protein YdbS with pleckstrin-like domain
MSDEPREFVLLGRREMWAWSALVLLVGSFNLWHWTTGTGEQWVGMVGAIVVVTVFLLLIARMAYRVRQHRSSR